MIFHDLRIPSEHLTFSEEEEEIYMVDYEIVSGFGSISQADNDADCMA